MRIYEVTVKTPAIYGREGSGTTRTYKILGGGRPAAARKAVKDFTEECGKRDRVSHVMYLTIIRVS